MVSIASRRLLAAAALTALGSLAPMAPARADDILSSFTNLLGLSDDEDKPEISYRERAPLVVPPKMELRPPQQSKAEANPAWPKDPDVERRKQADLLKKYPGGIPDAERRRLNGERISPNDVAAARSSKSSRGYPDEQDTMADRKHADWLGPDVMERESKLAKQQAAATATVSGVEPERRYLTDPPTGLRKPSANAEFKAPRLGRGGKSDDNGSPLAILRKSQPEPEE